jgi:hypothetical protein
MLEFNIQRINIGVFLQLQYALSTTFSNIAIVIKIIMLQFQSFYGISKSTLELSVENEYRDTQKKCNYFDSVHRHTQRESSTATIFFS